MKKFVLGTKWLEVCSILIIILGLFIALFNGTPMFSLFDYQINPVFWNSTVPCEGAKPFQGWIYGVLGSTILGWGILMYFITHYPYKNKQKWAWNCIFMSMLCWYLIDTTLSINFQVMFNALFNTVLFILVIIPLLMTRKQFFDQ
jgi:hypothetical protein